jgi:hypothetical protein
MFWPVTYTAASERRKRTRLLTSSAVPHRWAGIAGRTESRKAVAIALKGGSVSKRAMHECMLSKKHRKRGLLKENGGMKDKINKINTYIPIIGKATFCVDNAGSHAVDPNAFSHPLQGHALGQVLYACSCGAAGRGGEEGT